jgi:vacuolar-type H+-ATPase subunit C/Vma6
MAYEDLLRALDEEVAREAAAIRSAGSRDAERILETARREIAAERERATAGREAVDAAALARARAQAARRCDESVLVAARGQLDRVRAAALARLLERSGALLPRLVDELLPLAGPGPFRLIADAAELEALRSYLSTAHPEVLARASLAAAPCPVAASSWNRTAPPSTIRSRQGSTAPGPRSSPLPPCCWEVAVARCDFANAWIAARRSGLLGTAGVRQLAIKHAFAERVQLLTERGWVAPGPLADATTVCRALRATAAGDGADAVRFLEGRARRLVSTLLRLDDSRFLKMVLRGLAQHDTPVRILARAEPSPGLPTDVLRELATLPGPESVPAVLAQLSSPLATAAEAALAAGREEPRRLRMEVALDRAIVDAARPALRGLGEDARVARWALAMHVDHLNAVTLLALGTEPHGLDLHLPGGRLDRSAFAALATLPSPQRRAALARWLDPARRTIAADELADPAQAEELLARLQQRALHREARARPLSIAVLLAYIAERRCEARHLRVVLLGAEYGLPAETIVDLVEA